MNEALRVWHRNFIQFRSSLSLSLFWTVFEPLVILGALGYGLGSYVQQISGVSYIDFFFPALLCTTSMFVSFFESTYDKLSKLLYQKTYSTMILSPIEPKQIVLGEILWCATKGTFGSLGVVFVASFFGLVTTWKIIPAIIVIFIASFVFSAFGLVITSLVKNYDQIIYPTSGIIVPMSLLSGTYFPLDQSPALLKYLAYLFPLTHAVETVRELLLGKANFYLLIHVAILLLLAVFLTRLATRRITQKLIH